MRTGIIVAGDQAERKSCGVGIVGTFVFAQKVAAVVSARTVVNQGVELGFRRQVPSGGACFKSVFVGVMLSVYFTVYGNALFGFVSEIRSRNWD